MSTSPQRPISDHDDATRVQADAPPQTLEFAEDATNPSFGTVPPIGVPDYPFLSPPLAADEIGRLGEYRILKKLGEGGMGFVFRGEDPALKRFIALKVMRPEVAAKPMATDRFLREGRAAAGLKSDHIITIYQVGQANGVPFLAMEFLEGLPLDEWFKLQKKAIPLPHVLRVVRDTLRGLATAHEKGLIHRDIKPANLWLEKGTSRIKLLDFGLTRGNEADMQLTQEGAVVGTPAFMAPEQASGKPVDPRADLFSVGVVMYTLLAGKNPFARGSLMETLGAVGFETQAPITTVRSDVPKEYSDFLDRLLAKSPDARPTNATAALQELVAIEKAMQEGNRTLSATAASQPVVVVPLSAPAPQVWDELTDIDDAPPARPTRTKDQGPPKPPPNKKLLYGGGLFALLAVLGGIIIIITNKDGTQTKVEVPDGAKVEVKDKGKTVASVGGKKEPPKRVVMDADRKAAEMIRLRGGSVRIGEIWVAHNESLPEGPFKLNDASIASGDSGLTDSDLDLIVPLTELKNLTLSGPITDAGLAKIAASTWAPQLATLSLRYSRITDDGLKALSKFIALNYLDLGKSAGITGTGLRQLKDLQIQSLNLNSVPIKAEEYIHLAGFPQLQALDVINSGLTDSGLKNIVAAVPRLQQLQIQINSPLTDAGIKHLEKHPTLEHLNLGGLESTNGLTPASLESLRTIPNLRTLGIAWFGTGAWSDADLKRMTGFDKLETLGADFKLVTDDGLKTLTQLKSLKTLNMKGSKVTADGVAAFRKARPDVTLTSDLDNNVAPVPADPDRAAAEKLLPQFDLDILPAGKSEVLKLKAGSPMPAGTFAVTGVRCWAVERLPPTFADQVLLPAIAPLARLSSLEDPGSKLEMGKSDPTKWTGLASKESLRQFELAVPLTDAWLDAFRQFPNLTAIHVNNGKNVPIETLRRLSELKGLTSLRVFNLQGADRWAAVTALPLKKLLPSACPDIDRAACERIAAMPELETFSVYDMKLSAEMLSALGASPSIRAVSITKCEIPASGFDGLARLAKLYTLTIKVKEFDDTRLAQLVGSRSLLYLFVKDTAVTEAGVKALAAKLPNCTIEWSGGRVKGR